MARDSDKPEDTRRCRNPEILLPGCRRGGWNPVSSALQSTGVLMTASIR